MAHLAEDTCQYRRESILLNEVCPNHLNTVAHPGFAQIDGICYRVMRRYRALHMLSEAISTPTFSSQTSVIALAGSLHPLTAKRDLGRVPRPANHPKIP